MAESVEPDADGDVTLSIRLPRSLRQKFRASVAANDSTASQVLRRAISRYCATAKVERGAEE